MAEPQDLTGMTFGFLRVLAPGKKTYGGATRWRCVCVCGQETNTPPGDLKRRPNISCGCQHRRLASEVNRTHGLSRSPEYNTWANMKARCHNPQHPRYADYGGRGITVCKRWRNSFEAFLADVGRKPAAKHSLERKNNDAGYNPRNCRWASHAEQANNSRSSRLVTHDGRTLTIAQWSAETHIDDSVIWGRLARGWSPAEALTTPVSRHNKLVTLRRRA